MALTFTGTEYLTSAATPITTYPFTVFAWFQRNSGAGISCLFSFANSGSDTEYFEIGFNSSTQGHCTARSGTIFDAATTNTVIGGWNTILSRCSSATNRDVVLNGDFANKGTNTSSVTPVGIDRHGVGAVVRPSTANLTVGAIGYVAAWDAALTDSEGAALNAGANPIRIRSGNLKLLYPLDGRSAEVSYVSSYSLTATNTPAYFKSPPVGPTFAGGGWQGAFKAAAAGGISISASQQLASFTEDAVVAVIDAVTAAQAIGAIAQSAAAEVIVALSAGQSLANLSQSAAVTVAVALEAMQTLSGLAQSAIIDTGNPVVATGGIYPEWRRRRGR